uniref:MSP domain-containing protein n=1 Tax=Caenorhabditis tropicalis TaxID=1561998 RepID=A0A1I7UW84_9PELO
MVRLCIAALLVLVYVNAQKNINVPSTLYITPGETGTIGLPVSANYRREVMVSGGAYEEHIFRVCNGKNKAKCGFWENVKTKKKVPSGATTYNKNKKALVIKKMRDSDFGEYMTGNKKKSRFVVQLISFGK